MPSEPTIAFRCTAEERDEFIAVCKARGLKREEVLAPLVRAFIRDETLIAKLEGAEPVPARAALSAEEREIVAFLRNAGKHPGKKGEMELSVVRDFKRWVKLLKTM